MLRRGGARDRGAVAVAPGTARLHAHTLPHPPQYGDIFALQLPGQRMVFLQSPDALEYFFTSPESLVTFTPAVEQVRDGLGRGRGLHPDTCTRSTQGWGAGVPHLSSTHSPQTLAVQATLPLSPALPPWGPSGQTPRPPPSPNPKPLPRTLLFLFQFTGRVFGLPQKDFLVKHGLMLRSLHDQLVPGTLDLVLRPLLASLSLRLESVALGPEVGWLAPWRSQDAGAPGGCCRPGRGPGPRLALGWVRDVRAGAGAGSSVPASVRCIAESRPVEAGEGLDVPELGGRAVWAAVPQGAGRRRAAGHVLAV